MASSTATTAADIFKVSILGKDTIHCGFHLIPHIVETVLSTLPSSTYILITDTNIAKLHLEAFQRDFKAGVEALPAATKPRFLSHVIAPGETSKSREGKASIEDFLLSHKCTRDSVILALGGGVIGDLVGFVAATFMRGVRFCQIPTTLLAMVDSSVGGKTAIDTPHGKNLIGAFWQPEYIFIDAAFLETLPTREFSNGMAEVVKTAAIWNEQEFVSLESRPSEIFTAIQTPSKNYAGRTKATRSAAQELLLSVIVGSISVKAHIVTIDERETGLRNLVNFGHSIGHAIEAVLTPTILHGECVSIGMILEAELSRQMGILGQVAVGRLTRCLKGYNLPVSMADPRIASLPQAKLLTVDKLLDVMRIDKKNSGAEKKIVILQRIGATLEPRATGVRDELIQKTLAEAATVIPGKPKASGVVMSTPGSKSISNRALVLAALGEGTCKLKNLLHSDDTQVMMAALSELKGAVFSWEDGGETLVVEGGKGSLSVPDKGKELYLGNAGTAARFLTTVCTLVQANPLSTTEGETTIITGNARMKQRPIGPLVDALQANGSAIKCLETEGCLPLSIAPNGLAGGVIKLAATVSSQYVSSILLCAPYATEPVTLELVGGQVISQPYIDMTISMMASFGIKVTRRSDPTDPTGKTLLDIYDIPKGVYNNPSVYGIESDASSATYPLAIAAITGTRCTIKNIGSASLQGDARFAVEVLRPMGCTVEQTATSTTVQGPPVGQLKAIEEVDMTVMTDAFLTATVLGAVACGGVGKTRILGIANQRVKECNRIRAMIDELAKFNVHCHELDDGLEITGKPIASLKEGVSVYCYDDHRVAMAFSVLGCVVGGTIIEEKRCVEKTWPNWWDDLENKIGIKVEGVDLSAVHSSLLAEQSSASAVARERSPETSIVLTGMRGTGKTHIGRLAAAALGWTFIDADHYFEESLKVDVREFVQHVGWAGFRAAEATILDELLSSPKTSQRHIISLGGGVVETVDARDRLKTYMNQGGSIVRVVRPIEEIIAYLEVETARPAYGESVSEVYARREPWYKECSNLDFMNSVGGGVADIDSPRGQGATKLVGEGAVRAEVERFFKHIAGQTTNFTHVNAIAPGQRSYFLCLTYPDVKQSFPYIDELTEGVDALELRVDLMKSEKDYEKIGDVIPSIEYVQEQVTALRRVTSLPIIFTVRTKSQGGAFPDAATKQAVELLTAGLRLGVEYLDVELSLPSADVTKLVQQNAAVGRSKIIASWHDWSGDMKWDGEEVKAKYAEASAVGDLVKIVGKAQTLEDNFRLRDFVASVNAREGAKSIIAINMGAAGQMSRILNTTFTPVSHPLLPNKAAPGQLSFKQIQEALHLLGLFPAKNFYLFGTPIAHSMSPTLHNSGFELLGLPHRYELLETKEVGEEIKVAIASPDFGGASVTIPFKLDVMPLLDSLTEAAEAIGAVNTIIPRSTDAGQKLVGDNTDWLGIKACITRSVGKNAIKAGLVIGAGGTARAAIWTLKDLGAPVIYLFNRTKSKADALKTAFEGRVGKGTRIEVLASLDAVWKDVSVAPNVIIGTVPASATAVAGSDAAAGVQLPASIFQYRDGPAVVVDMAYKPAETPLLKLAKTVGAGNWSCVPGLEVLLEQGYVQFEEWTGRKCPKEQVGTRVWEKYNAQA